jgi:hypothetical protein
VFQRPPFMPAEPRRPATARSARPHAHIGRRCPPARSTATLRCFPPPPPPPRSPTSSSDPRSISDSGLRDCPFTFCLRFSLSRLAISTKWCVGASLADRAVFVGLMGGLESGATRHASVWCKAEQLRSAKVDLEHLHSSRR